MSVIWAAFRYRGNEFFGGHQIIFQSRDGYSVLAVPDTWSKVCLDDARKVASHAPEALSADGVPRFLVQMMLLRQISDSDQLAVEQLRRHRIAQRHASAVDEGVQSLPVPPAPFVE